MSSGAPAGQSQWSRTIAAGRRRVSDVRGGASGGALQRPHRTIAMTPDLMGRLLGRTPRRGAAARTVIGRIERALEARRRARRFLATHHRARYRACPAEVAPEPRLRKRALALWTRPASDARRGAPGMARSPLPRCN